MPGKKTKDADKGGTRVIYASAAGIATTFGRNAQWAPGAMVAHRGWSIIAEESNGRRFWTVRAPTGFPATETGSVGEAMDYIDGREDGEGAGKDIFIWPQARR